MLDGFFYNLDMLSGGLVIGKLQFLKEKKYIKFSAVIFFSIFGHENPGSGLDPDPD